MKNMNTKGFTLIEMLVVVAVIAILSGLTLTGIGGFTSRARDTERVGDLRNIQTHLELYFNKCGYYPGPGSVGTAGCNVSVSSWAEMATAIDDALNVDVPNDPVTSKTYSYDSNDIGTEYILGAELENDNNVLRDSSDIDDLGDYDWTPTGLECSDADPTFGYCIGSN